MQTETWIERVIIHQLASEDGHYKHGYRSRQQTTDEFVVDCAYLAAQSPDCVCGTGCLSGGCNASGRDWHPYRVDFGRAARAIFVSQIPSLSRSGDG